MNCLANDEGVTRDDVKFWHELVRFPDTPAYARLDLEVRGLYHSLRYLATAQGHLPHDPAMLACLCRLDRASVEAALPRLLESGLFVRSDDGNTIFCPLAEAHVEATVAKIVEKKKRGREAAERRWANEKAAAAAKEASRDF